MLHINKGHHWSTKHEHATVAEARACEAAADDDAAEAQWQAESELRAERAVERYYEEGTDAQHARYWAEEEEDRYWDALQQQREAAQERAAYQAEMVREGW